jgi:hypothetical protein
MIIALFYAAIANQVYVNITLGTRCPQSFLRQ